MRFVNKCIGFLEELHSFSEKLEDSIYKAENLFVFILADHFENLFHSLEMGISHRFSTNPEDYSQHQKYPSQYQIQ